MNRVRISTGTDRHSTAGRIGAMAPALSAGLLGLIILWGVSLAGTEVLHNAAHDTRHGLSFPCH